MRQGSAAGATRQPTGSASYASCSFSSNGYGLVLEVEAQREVRRLRIGVELVLVLGPAQSVVRFGVDARELRPEMDVAHAECEVGTIRGVQVPQSGPRKLVHRRQLTEAPELAALVVAERSLLNGAANHGAVRCRNGSRLTPQIAARILRFRTGVGRRVAVEVVGAVDRVVAALVVEHGVDAELPLEQVEAVLDGEQVAWGVVAREYAPTVDRDLGLLDDAVAIRIVERVRLVPLGVQ